MYRVKQFIWAIITSFKEVDSAFIEKYLNKDEIELFKKLRVSEQHHSIRVCKDAIKIAKQYREKELNKARLCKIALLHDVGKSEYPLNVIDKSIIVILDRLSKGKLRKYCNIKRIDSYYNHAKKSVMLLKKVEGYDNEFLKVIEKHHERLVLEDNIYLKIIKESDDLN
ncbi:MAG: HD domain-containing protein [Clostridium sp.]|uniref:HD domain-containing protein n=1 Tax=Clostridium sp. TaxID=1506 RepID=UPI003F3CCCC7